MATVEVQSDLKMLPLRALVAYAARCARRVQPLYAIAPAHPEAAACTAAIDRTIQLAEDFAAGRDLDDDTLIEAEEATIRALTLANEDAADEKAAYAANAAYAVIDAVLTALDVPGADEPAETARKVVDSATIATDAARAADTTVQRAARLDWEMLHRMHLGRYPEFGEPIDPSPTGILGPLVSAAPEAPVDSREQKRAAARLRRRESAHKQQAAQQHEDTSPVEFRTAVESAAHAPINAEISAGEGRKQKKRAGAGGAKSPRVQALIAKLQNQQDGLKRSRQALHAERTLFDTELQAFQRARDEFIAERELFRAERERSQMLALENEPADSAELAALRETYEARLETLRHEQERLEADRQRLECDRAALQEQRDTLQAEFDALRRDREQFEARQEHAAREVDELKQERRRLEHELQRLRASSAADATALPDGLLLPMKAGQPSEGEFHYGGPRPKPDADAASLRILIQRGTAKTTELAALFAELSRLYRDLGGDTLYFEAADCRVRRRQAAPRQRSAAASETRSIVEVCLRPGATPKQGRKKQTRSESSSAVWEQFRSCLCLCLRLDVGLDAEFIKGAIAPGNHPVRNWVEEAVLRNYAANEALRDDLAAATAEPAIIDSVHQQVQRIDGVLRFLERQRFLGVELTPDVETDAEIGETADKTSNRKPGWGRWRRIRRLLLLTTSAVAVMTAGHFWSDLCRYFGVEAGPPPIAIEAQIQAER